MEVNEWVNCEHRTKNGKCNRDDHDLRKAGIRKRRQEGQHEKICRSSKDCLVHQQENEGGDQNGSKERNIKSLYYWEQSDVVIQIQKWK